MRVAAALVTAAALTVLPAAAADAGKRPLRTHVAKRVERHRAKRWRAIGFALGTPAAAGGSAGTPAPQGTPVPTAAPAVMPAATPKPPALPGADPHSVSVGSTEFAFTLSQGTVSSGAVKVQFDNSRAEDPHDLEIDDAGGGLVFHLGQHPAGSVSSATVTLAPGKYTLLCPLADHESRGMKAVLNVAG